MAAVRLVPEEFIRRFLLHVLPKGFVKVRHYGLLAGANVKGKLERARYLLGGERVEPEAAAVEGWRVRLLRLCGVDLWRCPRCSDAAGGLNVAAKPRQLGPY